MAHAQKPDFVFLLNGWVHLNRQGASVQSTTGSSVMRISGSNAGYTMFRGRVKGTGYPLHWPVSPLLPSHASPCAITFQLEVSNDFTLSSKEVVTSAVVLQSGSSLGHSKTDQFTQDTRKVLISPSLE